MPKPNVPLYIKASGNGVFSSKPYCSCSIKQVFVASLGKTSLSMQPLSISSVVIQYSIVSYADDSQMKFDRHYGTNQAIQSVLNRVVFRQNDFRQHQVEVQQEFDKALQLYHQKSFVQVSFLHYSKLFDSHVSATVDENIWLTMPC